MKLVLVNLYVTAVLGSALYVRAAPYEWEQFHDGYEEHQHEPEIGESPKDSGYGKKLNTNKQIQSGIAVAKKESSTAVQEGGTNRATSNVGRKSSSIEGVGFQKSGKEHHKQQGDHFDHEGHEADKLHGEYDPPAGRGRQIKTVA